VPANVFVGDDRLLAKRSVSAPLTPVRDLLADLSRQSGVGFVNDENLPDEPVTLLAHDLPLSETLTAFADHFGYEWKRTGAGKSATYTLRLTEESRKAQAEARARRLADAADRLERQNEEFFTLSALPEQRRQDLAAEMPSKLAATTDPAQSEKLRNMHAVLLELNDPGTRRSWSPAVRRLLKLIPRQEITTILDGGAGFYCWPKLPGCREFPPSILQELQQIGRSEFSLASGFRGEVVSFRLRFVGVGARRPYLNWNLTVGQKTSQFQATVGFSGSAPTQWSLSASGANAASDAAEEWRTSPPLNVRATLRLPTIVQPRADGKTPNRRLGTALALLAADHKLNVIADGYWTSTFPGFEAVDEPLGEVLSRLARATGRTWRRKGDFLLFKSQDFFADRDAEPPATTVRRWAAAADDSLFTLEDLAELASLPDVQLTTLQEMAMRGEFPVLYTPLSNGRTHLKLWSALSASQRRKAQGDGLSYKDLDPASRLAFVQAATDPSARQVGNTPADEEMILTTKVRVTQRETQEWRVRGKKSAVSWNVPRFDVENQPVSREEAHRRFAQLDDSIKLADVQLIIRIGVTFSYDSDKGALSMTWLDLPPRWAGGALRSSGGL
jgi:hypothetical protein